MTDAAKMTDERRIWMIYSREHNAWWGPNHCGYFTDIASAGLYTQREADKVCADACRGRTGESDEGPPEFKMIAPDCAPLLLSLARAAIEKEGKVKRLQAEVRAWRAVPKHARNHLLFEPSASGYPHSEYGKAILDAQAYVDSHHDLDKVTTPKEQR